MLTNLAIKAASPFFSVAGYQKSKANSKFRPSEKSRAYQPKSMTCLASFDSDDMPTVQVCVNEDR